jgi:hypothetical protein
MSASVTIVGSFLAALALLAVAGEAAVFTVVNQCPYTVWAASVPVGGGRQLNRGETWRITAPAGTTAARIWACISTRAGAGAAAEPVQQPRLLRHLPHRRLQRAHELPPRRRVRVQPRAPVRRGRERAVPRRAEAGRGVQQRVPRVQAGRLLLRRLGGQQLRPDQLLEVLQGAVS